MNNLRIVFMGTPEFAVASLKALVENKYNVVGVITSPDKPAGRGQQVAQSAVKKYALQANLNVLQPEKLKDPVFINALKQLQADLFLVVAFRMLPDIVWNMPELGTYNLHASLLPKYRGAAPINWAIINGEKETGVTTFKLKHEIDTGNILFAERVSIGDTMTAGELHDRLMETGSGLILKTVEHLREIKNNAKALAFTEQDSSQASHAPKIFKETCRINWNGSASEIYNFIRGLSPYPAAYSGLVKPGGSPQWIKVYSAGFENKDHAHTNGSLITDSKTYLHVYCKNGLIKIKDVQLEGKRRMQVEDFLRGFSIPAEAVMI